MTQAKELARLAYQAIDDKKGEDIRIINIQGVSVIADYFIIASGSNQNQIHSIADNIVEVLGRKGYDYRQIEGYQTANWVLLDYNDVIIHIFNQDDRLFYDLERIWSDGRLVSVESLNEEDA